MTPLYGATLTLGGTISIGNYENVKVELSGAIRDEADLEALITGLRSALERLSTGDTQVRGAVESFARRVFGSDQAPAPASSAGPVRTPVYPGVPPAERQVAPEIRGPLGSPCTRTECDRYIGCNRVGDTCPMLGKDTTPAPEQVGRTAPEEPDPRAGLGRYASKAPAKAPQTTKTAQPSAAPLKASEEPKAPPSPAPAPKPAPAKKAASPAGTCEACGAGITAGQLSKSTLFRSRALCSSCMDEQPVDTENEARKAASQKYRDEQDAHAARAAEASRA